MIYTYPDYYKEFKCIADRCQDTCCAGWQIVVDDKSLKRYVEISEENPFKKRLEKSIDWDEEVFKQDECGRCTFLNRDNLCDMYTALGEDSLCHTCKTYPRHIEEFENIREVTLSLSCPEAARIILGKTEKTTFYTEETDEEEVYDDEFFDDLMLGILQDIRATMLEIMQDRALDITVRGAVVWKLAERLQDYIDSGDILYCEDALEEYVHWNKVKGHIVEEAKKELDIYLSSSEKRYDKSLSMFRHLYELEVLMESWEEQLDETALTLYGKDAAYYMALSKEFDNWLSDNMSDWQIQCEQIMVYFLSTYLCGAVYDGWVSSKVKMSVISVFFIRELLMSIWIKNDKTLTQEDIINSTYRYSRELEHSDINLDELESCMNE